MRKTNYLSLFALVVAGAAVSSAVVTGCGGDDADTDQGGIDAGGTDATGVDATSTPDSGPPLPGPDAGPSDDSGQPTSKDSGQPDTGVDAAHADAGSDSAANDSGTPDTGTEIDTGTPDTGVDSSSPADSGPADTGVDSSSAPDTGVDTGAPDTGVDSGGDLDAGSDAGQAVDASDDAASAVDAADAAIVNFANPIQVDVSSILNANSVVTTAAGGVLLTPMDGTGTLERNAFPTQTEVSSLNDAGVGLPDFASFAGDGVAVPHVQLSWTNAANVKNSIVVEGNAGTNYSFDVPPAKYSQVQIYATGGSGGSILNVTFTYAGGTASTTVTIPDWCVPGILPTGEYKLASCDRVQASQFYIQGLCNIYAIDLNPDSAQVLSKVSFSDNGTAGTYLVFYGATAW
jgi:hypothetical protein